MARKYPISQSLSFKNLQTNQDLFLYKINLRQFFKNCENCQFAKGTLETYFMFESILILNSRKFTAALICIMKIRILSWMRNFYSTNKFNYKKYFLHKFGL